MNGKPLPYGVKTKIRTVEYRGWTAEISKTIYAESDPKNPLLVLAWHVGDWGGAEYFLQQRPTAPRFPLSVTSEAWETVEQWAKDEIDKLVDSFKRCVDEELNEQKDKTDGTEN